MLAEDLDLLLSHDDVPATSILGSPDRRQLTGLRTEALDRLRDVVDDAWLQELGDRLDAGIGKTLGSAAPGVGVFVSPSLVHIVELPLPVRPRVVVDNTFATRDLVTALARSRRYLVLAIDGNGATLSAGMGSGLRPIGRRAGFPVEFPEAESAGERRLHTEPSRRRDAHLDRCHRLVDDALSAALPGGDGRAVFVVGDERRIHRFASTSAHSARIAAMVPGSARGSLDELAELVAPTRDEEVARRQQEAIDEVAASMRQSRFAAGVTEVWDLALDGRVDLLVVEEDHHCAAVVEGRGLLRVVDEPVLGEPDDVVDELIEVVLSAGGRVEAVASGALAEWDHLAAKLRH